AARVGRRIAAIDAHRLPRNASRLAAGLHLELTRALVRRAIPVVSGLNYLLQRLDAFDGIRILTTNLEGSIDPAFKRRVSLRLQFPFPDEEMRVRLWAAHVPPEAPTLGDFDFAELARRFPLSGGYIRNSALRAAFLAAQEQRPLSQSYLI